MNVSVLPYLEFDKDQYRVLRKDVRAVVYCPGTSPCISLVLLKYLRSKLNVPFIFLAHDDYTSFDNNESLFGFFDAIYSNSLSAIPRYLKKNRNVYFSPGGFNHQVFKCVYKKRNTYEYDMGFMGSITHHRERFLGLLKTYSRMAGLNCCIDFVDVYEMCDFFRKTKINLDISSSQNNERNRFDFRIWEVMGAGGFLLAEYFPGIEKVFTIGKELDCFRNQKELIYKVNYYMHNEGVREKIRRNGQKRVLNDFDLVSIYDKLINCRAIIDV